MSGITKYLNQSSLPAITWMLLSHAVLSLWSLNKLFTRPLAMYRDMYRYTVGAVDFGQRSDSFARGSA